MNTFKHNKCNSYFRFWKTRCQFLGRAALLVFDNLLDGFEATQLVRQVEGLEDVGEWSVPAGDTSDRCFQMQEALFLYGGSKFSTETVGQRSFMGDDDTAGLLDGLKLNKN